MPVSLTLFLAILATLGFFAVLFGTVTAIIEGRRAKAKPRIGLSPGDKPGTLSVWMSWDTGVFDVQVYRIRIQFVSPEYKLKEGQFTVSFDPVQKAPFIQSIELPDFFKELVEVGVSSKEALVTVEVKTVEELTLQHNYTLSRVRKIYHGADKAPKIANQLKAVGVDHPTVMTLDYQDWTTRKKKLRELEAAAKAKAAKAAPPKPAVAPAAPAAPSSSGNAAPAAGSAPPVPSAPVTPTPAPVDAAPATPAAPVEVAKAMPAAPVEAAKAATVETAPPKPAAPVEEPSKPEAPVKEPGKTSPPVKEPAKPAAPAPKSGPTASPSPTATTKPAVPAKPAAAPARPAAPPIPPGARPVPPAGAKPVAPRPNPVKPVPPAKNGVPPKPAEKPLETL